MQRIPTRSYSPKPLMDAMEKFVGEGFKAGWLKETAGLKGTAESTRIRSKGGKLTMTDGPFTEAKEVVGGYAIVETKTKDEAREVARRFMELHQIHWPEFECESEGQADRRILLGGVYFFTGTMGVLLLQDLLPLSALCCERGPSASGWCPPVHVTAATSPFTMIRTFCAVTGGAAPAGGGAFNAAAHAEQRDARLPSGLMIARIRSGQPFPCRNVPIGIRLLNALKRGERLTPAGVDADQAGSERDRQPAGAAGGWVSVLCAERRSHCVPCERHDSRQVAHGTWLAARAGGRVVARHDRAVAVDADIHLIVIWRTARLGPAALTF